MTETTTSEPITLAYNSFIPTEGCEDGLSPVIFLHGLAATKESWGDVPQAVADLTKRKTYSYDARNHGDSEFTEEFNRNSYVDDLFHFMDSHNISKAILVGHSLGGQTATNAALKKPERVAAVFSEDMYVRNLSQETCNNILGFIEMWINYTRQVPKEITDSEAVSHILDNIFSNVSSDSPLLTEKPNFYKTKFVLKRLSDGSFDVSYNRDVIIRSLKNSTMMMPEPEGQYKGPAYFMYGALSGFKVSDEKEHIRQHFPRAVFFEFPRAAHNIHSVFAGEFVENLIDCLKFVD